jgi:site-specific DNA-cytosine methylase
VIYDHKTKGVESVRILVACEESQAVTIELRRLGHEAYSCDIIECSGGHPEWHLQQDVIPLIKEPWDMIIAFPPCTHLAVSGARHFEQKRKDGRQQRGIDFFMMFANADCPRIAIENPVGIMSSVWRKPDQIIQPYQFGDPHKKTTCLWLKGLPKLTATKIVKPTLVQYTCNSGKVVTFDEFMVRGFKGDRAKARSKTFPGIARAMAEQWAGVSK